MLLTLGSWSRRYVFWLRSPGRLWLLARSECCNGGKSLCLEQLFWVEVGLSFQAVVGLSWCESSILDAACQEAKTGWYMVAAGSRGAIYVQMPGKKPFIKKEVFA